jgi:CheY-like chemotaxis protein
MLQVLLQIKGYRVLAADNGINALEMAMKRKPDAILLDLQLPVMDGLSVSRNLRLHPGLQAVPIIIISGHDPNAYRQKAIDAGCNEYLLKPINFDSLQTMLDRFVPRERRARVKFASPGSR